MPSAVVEAAFQARYYEYTLNDPPLYPAILSSQPPGIDTWVVLQYPVVNGSQPTIGRHYFEEGAARLVVNVRRTAEMEAALSIADNLASIFRGRKFHGIETFVTSSPIVNDVSNDGNWFSLSVIVPYRYQFDD